MGTEKKEEKRIARRGFLKGAAVGAAGLAAGALVGCGPGSNAGVVKETVEVPVEVVKEVEAASSLPEKWDYEADVVVVGGGISGLVAAIRARDLGASVIVVEANYACGGHAITSGGFVHLGGGNSLQKAKGVVDSADQYYLDHTNPITFRAKYNIREVVRAAADVHADAFDFLLENGWTNLGDMAIQGGKSYLEGGTGADSVPRTTTSDRSPWEDTNPLGDNRANGGLGLTRPLEVSARDKGVQFIMNHHMDKIYRDGSGTGRVVGIQASYTPRIPPGSDTPLVDVLTKGNVESTATVEVKANKGVIVATGGSSSNWKFHSTFDPRYGPEHANGVGGDPFSFQDASGELACLAIGASLGATNCSTVPSKARAIGCQYGYRWRTFGPGAPVWPFVRAYGLEVESADAAAGIVYVNMLGQRFHDEDAGDTAWWDAAMGSVILDADTKPRRVAGPIWGIFDADHVQRMGWNVSGPPDVDTEEGYFFSADTLAELAGKIVNKFYEDYPMPAANLEEAVARYNSFVDSGVDEDFGRQNPQYKIQTPPFYAAWAPNAFHDTIVGVKINDKFQVLDIHGEVVPSLYCVGESSSGQAMHGHGKNISNGYAAGTNVVQETAA